MSASNVVRAYECGAFLAQRAPAPVALGAGRLIGTGAALVASERRTIVERNLRRALGTQLHGRELRRLVRETFRSYARYYFESFRLPSLSRDEIEAGFTIDGYEHIDAAFDRGSSPILALPHLGGWEWGAFWLALVPKVPVTAVAEALEPPELFAWFTELRRSLGMEVVALGPDAGRDVMRAIRQRRALCLLSDRYLEGAGVEVEFFGERTTLPAGPAMLALRTGAPLLPCAVYFRATRHHGVVRPAIPAERAGSLRADVARVTQHLATELEALIRVAPEQWHLLQPSWPSDYAALGRPLPERSS